MIFFESFSKGFNIRFMSTESGITMQNCVAYSLIIELHFSIVNNLPEPLKKILILLRAHRNGLTITEIAKKLSLNRNSTAKYLDILLISGDIALNSFGPAKVYTISRKITVSAMLRFSADIILMIDQEMRVLDVNENALTILGLSRNDLIGNRVDKINSPLISRLSIPDVLKNIQVTGEIQREFVVTRQNEDYHYRVRLIPTVFDNQEEGLTIIGEDITAQIRFEERLLVSEARFRAIVEDQIDFICRWHPDGTLTFINEALSRYIGVSCKDASGQSIYSYIFPEDQALTLERLATLKKNPQVQSAEIRVLDKDGQYRWHQWNTRGIYDNNGTLIECQSVGRDITELKESQEALRQSEQLYRTILDNIQDVYYRSDIDGNLTMVSPLAAKMLGYNSDQEILGQNIAEKIYFNAEERKQFLATIYREKKVTDYEIALKKRDGSPVIIATNSHLLYDTAGNITGVEGIIRDISVRKQAERALRESEERYRNIVEDQTEFICRFKPDGTHVFANAAYCRYFGLEREAIIGHRFIPEIPSEDRENVKRFLASLTPEHPVDIIEHRIIMPDGKVRWQRWSDRAIFDSAGNVTEYQSVGRDITEKQEHARKIRESEERFRMITELSPFPISFMDSTGKFQYLNRKFRSSFGYTLDDIPTMNAWFSKAFPDNTKRMNAIQAWKQARELEVCNAGQPLLFPVTCKDGFVRQIQFCPIILSSGEQFVVYEDFTDKTESDRLRSVLASIVNSSNDAIIGKSLDGTILSWNKTAERYYGYLAEEVIGKPIDIIVPPELRNQVALFLRRAGNGETIENYQTVRLRKDGSRIEVGISLSPIKDENGRIIGISTITQNIAERRKADTSRVFRQQVLHGS
jgi:PAS domain S-box-containing protein